MNGFCDTEGLQEMLEVLSRQEQMIEIMEEQQADIEKLEQELSDSRMETALAKEALEESMSLNESLNRENRRLTRQISELQNLEKK